MTSLHVITQPEDPGMALARAAAVVMGSIRETMDLRTPEQLPAGECAVKVCGDWYGYAGLDSQGRMVLWGEGDRSPSMYPPTEGETFAWRLLIGGTE